LRHLTLALALCLLLSPAQAAAQITLEGDGLSLELPAGWQVLEPGVLLAQQRAEDNFIAAASLDSPPNHRAVLVLTTNPTRPLSVRDLKAHLKASEEAVRSVPTVELLGSSVLSEEAGDLGLLEVRRRDRALRDDLGLDTEWVLQMTFVYPGPQLTQVFVYLPASEQALRNSIKELVPTALRRPIPTPTSRSNLPLFVALAAGTALLVIVALRVHNRRRRRREDQLHPLAPDRGPGEHTPRAPWEEDLEEVSEPSSTED